MVETEPTAGERKPIDILQDMLAEQKQLSNLQQEQLKEQQIFYETLMEQFKLANKRIRTIEIRAGIFLLIIVGSMILVGCSALFSLRF